VAAARHRELAVCREGVDVLDDRKVDVDDLTHSRWWSTCANHPACWKASEGDLEPDQKHGWAFVGAMARALGLDEVVQ